MMTFKTWKSETKRGITSPRSKALQTLDDAFEDYDKDKKFTKKKVLVDALIAWMGTKGDDWKDSIRNSKGTVSQLLKDLSADPTFAPKLSAYVQAVTATATVVAGYVPGKWERTKDVDGRWHDYVLQERGNSCGPACVAIVKRGFHNLAANQISEEQIRGAVALAEGHRLNEGISTLGAQAISAHDWVNVGSNNAGLIQVLKKSPAPVPNARDGGGLSAAAFLERLRQCTPRKPCIIGWNWQGGGGHWTVCAGPTKDGSQLLILDPWTGVEYIPNDALGYLSYQGGSGMLDLTDPMLTS